MIIRSTLSEREYDSFIESPTRPGKTAIEVIGPIRADSFDKQTYALRVSDGLGSNGVNGNLNLLISNTAYEVKVSDSRLLNRKSVTVQALDNDFYWGYSSAVTSSTGTLIYKGQFVEFACDPASTFQVWLVCLVNNSNARITESP